MSVDISAVTRLQALLAWSPERPSPALPAEAGVLRPQSDLDTPPAATKPLPPLVFDAPFAPELELGAAARLVARLAAGMTHDGAAGAKIRTTAPLSAAPGNSSAIAAGLQAAVNASGLFYESHLADWTEGSFDKNHLLREPQASLIRADGPAAPGAPSQLTPQAESIVQRQLAVLERGEACWQGQLWPGQEAEVRISDDERREQARDQTGERVWQACVSVSMRAIGKVNAQIGLSERNASIAIHTADPVIASILASGRGDLARALRERGLALSGMKVDRDDPAAPR